MAVPYTTVALLGPRGQVVAQRRLTHHDGTAGTGGTGGDTEPGRILANAAEGLGALLAALGVVEDHAPNPQGAAAS
jgi:hypothetical protein